MSISSRCKHPEHAAKFLAMTVSGDYQRTSYFNNGGQPGHRKAWEDEQVNRAANGFFRHTLQTLDLGSMRPRFKGYIDFQERAGADIRQFLLDGDGSCELFVHRLNRMMDEYR